ncbi:MAG: DNA-binding protein [Candidatus Cloacimonetes bacterium]|nr:DNA-binding protein [Candidatus Cloacimonadota bacterium]
MKDKKIGEQIFIRLERGEEIIGQLLAIIPKYGIKLGKVSGIGACSQVTLGNFDVNEKKYNKATLYGSFEITNLAGNISEMAGEPYLHVHVTLGDEELRCRGGHLNAATVSATCELIITIFEGELERFRDESSGLNFWKLD